MPEFIIKDVPVIFPFEPYSVQRAYMERVIECLDNSGNAVLESPTGTGKTLSLLCSTLGWVQNKKSQLQKMMQEQLSHVEGFKQQFDMETANLQQRKTMFNNLVDNLNSLGGDNAMQNAMIGVPRVIYASRTHSQISQAMQELKRTSYNHVKAAVIGSRDQLCIHPDLVKESNANKIQLCKIKVKSRTCHFHNRLESQKSNPDFRETTVMDIEDIVRVGKKLKCCPYYASKELVDGADITFMPYNYLLDPKMRKANKIDLQNTIIILDEAHNVEKMCEESASAAISSSQIAVAIDDVSQILTPMANNDTTLPTMDEEDAPDFTVDDLTLLKEIFLTLEKTIDELEIKTPQGDTHQGGYIFGLLEKANINVSNVEAILKLIDTLIQYAATVAEASSAVFRRGAGLQFMSEFLTIVFSSSEPGFRERVNRCYKVYVEPEQQKPVRGTKVNESGWFQPKTTFKSKLAPKTISFWCFSPGFGMQHLLGKNIRSVILTSGTLAPLKPLIAELGIPINVRLENPHIVNSSQVLVKIIGQGSDKETLNSNFQNRDNINYITSLGRTISSVCPVIPHGLLIFFPSYSILNKCKASWQESGIWSSIEQKKPIFVEPQTKEAFVNTMTEYYDRINQPNSKGAIFMAVCRGKVSEGLDFADMNGRAVIITGLPYPPYMDPKVRLKKQYLGENRTRENEMLSGDDWYFLEASRAVNQAIGRVIRHKNDYGAILLCDTRFHNPRQKTQLSGWIQGHLKAQNPGQTFGSMIGELARFFRNAERTLPQPGLKPLIKEESLENKTFKTEDSSQGPMKYKLSEQSLKKSSSSSMSMSQIPKANEAFCVDMYRRLGQAKLSASKGMSLFSGLNETVKSIDFNNMSGDSSSLVKIHKRQKSEENSQENSIPQEISPTDAPKKKKYKIVPNSFPSPTFAYQSSSSVASVSASTSAAADSQMSSKNYVMDTETELPKDRKDLLRFLKNTLSPEKYDAYLKTFLKYNGNSNYEEFRDSLICVFSEKRWFYILKGMVRFTKSDHRTRFSKDIEDHIRANS